jgi:branched-chain amino acid transport system ATP-binding protein
MPEDRRLIGPLSVRDNLLLAAGTGDRGQPQARLDAIVALLPELGPLVQRRAASLSGGQQKLVALARALVAARSLLLLDEPLEGVSPALSARMAEVVRSFQAREPRLAVLVAESDLNRLRLLAHRLYTIERGEVSPEAPGPEGR